MSDLHVFSSVFPLTPVVRQQNGLDVPMHMVIHQLISSSMSTFIPQQTRALVNESYTWKVVPGLFLCASESLKKISQRQNQEIDLDEKIIQKRGHPRTFDHKIIGNKQN